MEISRKTYLLELSTMIHVVRKQIKYILVNEGPRNISLARLRGLCLLCLVYQSVNDVSLCFRLFRDENKLTRLFK